MKKIGLVLMVMSCLSISFAQIPNWEWARQATGGQEGWAIAKDVQGNVYATGTMSGTAIFGSDTLVSIGGGDIYVVKYSPNGNLIWAKHIGGSIYEKGFSIATDAFGNVYITGEFLSPTIVFGADTLVHSGGSYTDIFIAKLDTYGNVLWGRGGGGSIDDVGEAITTDASGNIYVTGYFTGTALFGITTLSSYGGGGDVFILKYDPSGNLLWAKHSGGIGYDYGYSITADLQGNLYVTGSVTGPTATFDSITLTVGTGSNIFIAKYNSNGDVLWAKSVGSYGYGAGNSITTDLNGDVYVTGLFESSPIVFDSLILPHYSYRDIFIAKYNSYGNVIWAKTAGSDGNDNSYSVTTDTNSVYISGSFRPYAIIFDTDTLNYPTTSYDAMFIVKYDFNGNLICTSQLPSGGDDNNAIVADGFGNIYLTGDFVWSLNIGPDSLYSPGETFFIAKYNCNGVDHTGIAELPSKESTTLFPNPTTSSFTITSTDKIESVKLYNVLGEVVWQNKYNNVTTATIDFTGNIFSPSGRSGGAAGIYFAEIKTEKGIVRKKVVKE